MSVRLHVNIDHVATLRRLRDTRYPDVAAAARTCLEAGAHGITMHLREDRRHVTDADVQAVRGMMTTRVFNLEMALTDEMLRIAVDLRPDVVTLVPERREERTTEGGLDVAGRRDAVAAGIERLRKAGIRPSLFINPDPVQIEASARSGARTVELHTGEYCGAPSATTKQAELATLQVAARSARAAGLEVAAGHGLYYDDVGPIAAIPQIEELNIGHGIVCRAVEVGLAAAVRDMLAAIGA